MLSKDTKLQVLFYLYSLTARLQRMPHLVTRYFKRCRLILWGDLPDRAGDTNVSFFFLLTDWFNTNQVKTHCFLPVWREARKACRKQCVCLVFVILCFSGTGCLEVHYICFNRWMKVIHICLNLFILQSDLWNVCRISQTLQSASDIPYWFFQTFPLLLYVLS